MDKDPAKDKPGSKAEPRLTLKQDKFADEYAATGNGTEAAKRAGYVGDDNQLGVQAYDNLHNPKIQRAILARLQGMSAHGMNTLLEAMDATKSKAFLDKAGNLVTTDPQPDHRTRLQAVEIWAKMLSKFSVGVSEEVEEDPAVQEQEWSVADRVVVHHAANTVAELAEIDRKLADHYGDHADQVGEQSSTTNPVGTEAATAETNRELADHHLDHAHRAVEVDAFATGSELAGMGREQHDHEGNGGSTEEAAGTPKDSPNS